MVLFNGVAVAALFVLRRREPDAPRPFRRWGYPVLPAMFVVVCAVSSPTRCRPTWWRRSQPAMGPSAAGLLIIALGLPLYWWFNRGAAAQR